MTYEDYCSAEWSRAEQEADRQEQFELELYDSQWKQCWSDIVTEDYLMHPAVAEKYRQYFEDSYRDNPMDFETWLNDQHAGDINDWCAEWHNNLTGEK